MHFDKKYNTPAIAAGHLIQGFKYLMRPGLRRYIVMPVLINLLLYSGALLLGYHYLSGLIEHFIPAWLNWLQWLLWPLFFISFFIMGFFTFTLLANLLASPFYGGLSAKASVLTTGQSRPVSEQPVADVIRAELGRVWYFSIRALPLLVLSFIPGVNVLSPLLWALFGAWGMALEYFAYPLENEGIPFTEQRKLAKSILVGALSFGGLTAFLLTIPLVNILVAPAAVIGATLYCSQLMPQTDTLN
jgi:CysZ protein